MTAKEWLETMKQAADYNPAMTTLIEKYGEMLLEEHKVANKNFIKSDVIGMFIDFCQSMECDKIYNNNIGIEAGVTQYLKSINFL